MTASFDNPALVNTGATRAGVDAVSVLSVYIVLMMAVPSAVRYLPAGTLGAPATMLAILVFFWWVWEHLHRSTPHVAEPQWVRRAALLLLVVILASYAHASLRPVPADEVTPLLSWTIQFAALLGLTLTACDGITSTTRLIILLRRIALVGGVVGLVAFLQFFTHRSWLDHLVLPGLSMTGDSSISDRGMFSRPTGTAQHPLEFGAVIAMIVPIAITSARVAVRRRPAWWILVAILVVSACLSVSRSALICTTLAVFILALGWSNRDRLIALGTGVVGAVVIAVAIPGLVGTLRGMFGDPSNDGSVQSRTEAVSYVMQMWSRFFWLGRGYGTFLPKYWIADNGYLGFLVTTGILGITALSLLYVAALVSARFGARRFDDPRDREYAHAVFAACFAGIVSMAFFDLPSFPQAAGLLFLLLGVCGAIRRLAQAERRPATVAGDAAHAAAPVPAAVERAERQPLEVS
ncbi:O-antigen ligase family protein [Branchiibius cervicis]|uniref:O-antigen ligase family protein n=1 Tax=Branchiibius cervicis TaxID=908252 RepID=A0ABW2AUP2_9MICO